MQSDQLISFKKLTDGGYQYIITEEQMKEEFEIMLKHLQEKSDKKGNWQVLIAYKTKNRLILKKKSNSSNELWEFYKKNLINDSDITRINFKFKHEKK